MKKRIFSVLLAVVFCVSAMCVPASALSNSDWEYSMKNNEITLQKYIGPGGHVDVPAKINGVPVVKIDAVGTTWSARKDVTSITVPDTVREIRSYAFMYTPNLESVELGKNVRTIGSNAFKDMEKLKSITLPDSAVDLDTGIFERCAVLETVRLPKGLTSIPGSMFRDCTSLKSIEIPASVETIGNGAFSRTGLTEVTIPAKTKELYSFSFSQCKDLKNVKFAGRQLTRIDDFAFNECTGLQRIYLPVSLKEIGDAAFMESGLKGAVVPYGVKRIDFHAFASCPNLTWLSVPSSATNVGLSLIEDCPQGIGYCPKGSHAEKSLSTFDESYLLDASADARIQVIYNDTRISFGPYGQSPVAEKGRTLVPLRSIFEAMGASVEWNQSTKTVTAKRGSTEIQLKIGDNKLYKNGKLAAVLDVPAKAIHQRTMIPVRAIAESFGANVGWNGNASLVLINE